MKAMIFAAGLGTRLKPITDRIPKALLPIGGKTLLEWQIDQLRAAGITDITINIHHFADQIVEFCAAHDSFGCSLHFSDERDMLLETGGGLRHARPFLDGDEPILVMNVDILSNIELSPVALAYQEEDLALLVVSPRETQRYFCFENDYLCGWTNIATGEVKVRKSDTLLAFSGLQIVHPRIFDLMTAYPDKFSITQFYLDMCSTERIKAYIPSDYRMMDIGKIDHLAEAEAFARSL